jgi:hypothetical protein
LLELHYCEELDIAALAAHDSHAPPSCPQGATRADGSHRSWSGGRDAREHGGVGETCQGPARDQPGTCQGPARDLPGT